MTPRQALTDVLKHARDRSLGATSTYRYARHMADRANTDRECQHITDRLRNYLSARDGLDSARDQLHLLEEFARSARLQDPEYTAKLQTLKTVLNGPVEELTDAEHTVASATMLLGQLRALQNLYVETLANIAERMNRCRPKQRAKLTILQRNLRFDLSGISEAVAALPAPPSESEDATQTSIEDQRFQHYQSQLLERARSDLPESEVTMYTSSLDLMSKRPDHPINRRMRWSLLHELRRRLFSSLIARPDPAAEDSSRLRPPSSRAIESFWTGFQQLNRLLVDKPDEARFLLAQLVDALRSSEGERLRRTTVICKMLETTAASPAYEEFYQEIASTRMLESYKMVLLTAMLDLDCLPGEASLTDLAPAFVAVARRSADLSTDINADLNDLRAVESLILNTPIKAFIGAFTNATSPWFAYSDGVFRTLFEVRVEDRAGFVARVREIVHMRLRRYLAQLRLSTFAKLQIPMHPTSLPQEPS